MVRNYQKKSERKLSSPSKVKAGVDLIKAGWSIRKAAAHVSVNRQTLHKFYLKVKDQDCDASSFKLSFKTRTIFPQDLKKEIAEYCIQVSNMGYGLSAKMARDLAYEVAIKNNLKLPPSWEENKSAGVDWFFAFQKRHPNISLRVPEGCSIARAMAFNQTNVNLFFDKLAEVRERHPSFKDGTRVFNLDESQTSTVHNIRRLISPKGAKQVHQIKGAERGVGVTTCAIIGAVGSILPPAMIFPRKKFVPDFLINAFPGTLGLGNEKGYMTKEVFYKVMEHFIKCTGSTLDNPTLLLLDNVDSHFSTRTLDLAKQSGVTVFTFPPHCTHRLQPLDVGFFGPFKCYYDQAIHNFLADNPGCPPTIYRIAGFVSQALSSITPLTIINSFAKPGIVPFNRNVFREEDFAMAAVTHQPDPSSQEVPGSEADAGIAAGDQANAATSVHDKEAEPDNHQAAQNGVGEESVPVQGLETSTNGESLEPAPCYITPKDIRGLPVARPQVSRRKPRRKGKCMIATDTPEENQINERERAKEKKDQEKEERKRKREEKAAEKAKEGPKKTQKTVKKKKRGAVNRALSFDSSHSDIDDPEIVPVTDQNDFPPMTKTPEEDDFVLVALAAGKEKLFYIGKIISNIDEDGDLGISYYRKKTNRNECISFVLPDIPDLKSVHLSDVKTILPKPKCPATRRQKSVIKFDVDLSKVKLG